MKPFVNFGHDILDVYTALALDDVLIERAVKSDEPFIRTYEFSQPAAVVAYKEDLADIIDLENIDYTRRKTAGSAMWLDNRLLAYSIILPQRIPDLTKAHHWFGHKIGLAIKNLGIQNIFVGERYSITLGKNSYSVISGNSGHNFTNAFLYHGILVVQPLNIDKIKTHIKLRKRENFDELAIISRLPSIESVLGKEVSKSEISKLIINSVSSGNYRNVSNLEREEILERASEISSVYKDLDWIYSKNRNLRSNLGFCLVAEEEEWKEKEFYSLDDLEKKFLDAPLY